jgi:hypothetical protein
VKVKLLAVLVVVLPDCAEAPAGFVALANVKVAAESPSAVFAAALTRNVVDTAVPSSVYKTVSVVVIVTEGNAAADAGTTDIRPKPNADTATSAMRLRSVFVDICFLSLVDPRTIRSSAWEISAFSYVRSERLVLRRQSYAMEELCLRGFQENFKKI